MMHGKFYKNKLKGMNHTGHLEVKDIGIDTYRENIVFMRYDCEVCNSEGFTALTRVVITNGSKSIIATLNVVTSEIISHGEAGLSTEAMKRLGVKTGDFVRVSHLNPIESFKKVRAKMYGKQLSESDFFDIVSDIIAGKYSNVELAAFITSCVNRNLSQDEIIGLTKAMINTGQRLDWGREIVMDKHCVGGLPGNRTTPIVVSIIAASGLLIPKTSSRAITSPAGTADTMETMAPVELSIKQMRKVVETEGGCITWGGAVQLSPADDILISVEKALDVDSEGQMIASVLSKKVSAGSTHVIVDIPVGDTAKVRTNESAVRLKEQMEKVASAIGIRLEVVATDGSQPVGSGIGPALEAFDVLDVLNNTRSSSQALKERALQLAAKMLELGGKSLEGQGLKQATEILESGKALNKFMRICEAQGGFHSPPRAKLQFDFVAGHNGTVVSIDNRTLARIAKLAGAPRSQASGVVFHAFLGKRVVKGDVLYTIHTDSAGELSYARDYATSVKSVVSLA
jgi:thymidine phosphorylase